jgi:hypothetical protein
MDFAENPDFLRLSSSNVYKYELKASDGAEMEKK